MITTKIYSKPIARLDLESILQSDASLYPSSLTLRTLQNWYDTNSSNFINYYISNESHSEATIGVSISFPMKATFWKRLITGDLNEHEITGDMLLEQNCSLADEENEYGIHIWHIKKFELWNKLCLTNFRDRFWSDLQYSVDMLNSKNKKCIGFSSLCATDEGTRAMKKLGFDLQGYYDFIVQNRQGQLKVIHSTDIHAQNIKNKDEWKMIFQCGIYTRCIHSV
ncbi:unnamed protein product [Adineta ricciae]|uniref:Uncharacterized protein n=1 Tax=Adineta ricciae TaxID=249248 RepID=A0A814SQI8_ADIRI|nr:unnamed protein product [Adineta ricciae]